MEAKSKIVHEQNFQRNVKSKTQENDEIKIIIDHEDIMIVLITHEYPCVKFADQSEPVKFAEIQYILMKQNNLTLKLLFEVIMKQMQMHKLTIILTLKFKTQLYVCLRNQIFRPIMSS
ncbi:Hypothetical_protein [Hexamita inflata]|uniref:Hypothetical_protein n=1 Tax=Hexamita inflata TaxID=28002 RepID=A0AA86QIT9_9EUKA|nr:Hypothetical protein HINF_LOCUS28491 [Hexamita inflata]CAI9959093.1 Hypothetical protein HINF_LOCUS46738 [Hexamita inflata]